MSLKKWIIVDFDCYHGCNNPEFKIGCDESLIRIKIDDTLAMKHMLAKKYMRMPCPRCGKVGEHKRSGYWLAPEDGQMEDYDGTTFTPADVQDYTAEMMEAKISEIAHLISNKKEELTALEKEKESIKEWVEIHKN